MMKKIAIGFFLLSIPALALAIIGAGFDSEGPVVTITAPTAGQSFDYGTASVDLNYSAVDAGGGSIAKYWVKRDSAGWVDNSLNTGYAFSGLSSGSHAFYVIATDDSDNNSDTASVSFTISSAPPVSCGNGSCDAGEDCSNCSQDCGTCPVQETCALKGGSVCTASQKCSGSIVAASDTSYCCIGGCVEKTCTDYGGVVCAGADYECSNWINQGISCCASGYCNKLPETTILCSFPVYLDREPVTSIFVELAELESAYDFNVVGERLTINPDPSNSLSDVIVSRFGSVYIVSSNLVDSPEFTPDDSYLLELLKKNQLYGSSAYSAKAENFKEIYDLIGSSRLRWWNAPKDDTCEPKLKPSELGVSLQTMHYFRINNLWLIWNDLAKK